MSYSKTLETTETEEWAAEIKICKNEIRFIDRHEQEEIEAYAQAKKHAR